MNVGPVDLAGSRFDSAISSGRAVLVVGDVFADSGNGLISEPTLIRAIRRELSNLAGLSDDSAVGNLSLHQVYSLARSSAKTSVDQVVARYSKLEVFPKDGWIRLMNAPWQRIYDLTGATMGIRKVVAPKVVDAICDSALDRRVSQLIYMCGISLQPDYSVPAGGTQAPRDVWYKQFGADILSHPLVIVAAQPHPDLWHYLSLRNPEYLQSASPAFMFVDQSNAQDRKMAKLYGVDLLEVDTGQLIDSYVVRSRKALAEGRRQLAITREGAAVGVPSILVDRLLEHGSSTDGEDWRFLRGYLPNWRDVAAGRTVRLSRLSSLYRKLNVDPERRNIVVVKGRAGSGKSTLLMRLGYEFSAKGRTAVWIDRGQNLTINDLVRKVADLSPDLVIVDDVNIFGDAAESLLCRFNREGKSTVVASVRRSSQWTLDGADFEYMDGDSDLGDRDLSLLLESLDHAGLLGKLQGQSPRARLDTLRDASRRDLLSALIEVVTGEPFEQYVKSEYSELPEFERLIYAAVCFAESIYETQSIPEEDLLQIAGRVQDYAAHRAALMKLIDERRLVVRVAGGLVSRHRAIADVVVRSLGPGVRAAYVERMLLLYAGRAANIRDQSNPDRRLMVNLLSHSRMTKYGIGTQLVRRIYAAVQSLLQGDFHYWLQRGAFEVEHGHLDDAVYLGAARSLPGGEQDYYVTTEWGFMRLRQAVSNPFSLERTERARLALEELIGITRVAGSASPHTFAVAIMHGTDWICSSRRLSAAEKLRIAHALQDVSGVAQRVCPLNADVRRSITKSQDRLASVLENVDGKSRFPVVE